LDSFKDVLKKQKMRQHIEKNPQKYESAGVFK